MARIIKTPLGRCHDCKLRAMIDGHCVHCARLSGGTRLAVAPQLHDPDDEMDDDDDDDPNCPL